MEHTKGLWEVVESRDESCDKPYFNYRIRAYPYGPKAGPQPICLEILNKGDAHYICRCVNCHDALLAALEEIASAERQCCPRCEGNGRLWADGKAHLLSEQSDTVLCGNCGGSGYLQPDNAAEIAADAIAEAEED